ncbi:hypothetical protein RRG08_033884 [Elysia crispata]|uniref:Uncharacterized protein n=1 Tax=Elysia crispata TaxID=231223 RepID=A0AAE1B8K3_9GAST|nr:hypothetical protein RRG08_033884 [Elysia crispata]
MPAVRFESCYADVIDSGAQVVADFDNACRYGVRSGRQGWETCVGQGASRAESRPGAQETPLSGSLSRSGCEESTRSIFARTQQLRSGESMVILMKSETESSWRLWAAATIGRSRERSCQLKQDYPAIEHFTRKDLKFLLTVADGLISHRDMETPFKESLFWDIL